MPDIYRYFATFGIAFAMAFFTTPAVKNLALKIGAVDVPKDDRRMHRKPMALIGGLAIIFGFITALAFNLVTGSGLITVHRELAGLLGGVAIITVLGVFDDIKKLRARTKLFFQIAAALSTLLISGSRITQITNPFNPHTYFHLSPYISYPLTILWIVGITNAVNFLDGLDGLTAGVSAISSLSLFFVSLQSANLPVPVVAYTALITIALAGSSLGFLPHNFNPAKIFMGETGAAFLGFTLGVISIQGTVKSYALISVAVPLLILGLPIFDTAFAILRRIGNGKPISQGDKGHVHHRLIKMGLSQRQSVIIMYTVSGALGLSAIMLADRGIVSALVLFLAIFALILGALIYMRDTGRSPASLADAKDDSEEADTLEDSPDLGMQDISMEKNPSGGTIE